MATEVKKTEPPIVEKTALGRLWERAFLGYFTPYMKIARDEGIDGVKAEKLPGLWQNDKLDRWAEKFVRIVKEQWKCENRFERKSLMRTIFQVYWLQFFSLLFLRVLNSGLKIMSATALKMFLEHQELHVNLITKAKRLASLLWGVALVALQLIVILVSVHVDFWSDRISMRVESSLYSALFKRILDTKDTGYIEESKIMPQEDPKIKSANAYNLMMIDIPCIGRCVRYGVDLIVLPVSLLMSFGVLGNIVGVAAVAGLSVLLLVMMVIVCLEILNGFLKKNLLYYRDIRTNRCHELISNIKQIRIAGLEDLAAFNVAQARKAEMRIRALRTYIHSLSSALSNSTDTIVQISVFGTYIVWGSRSSQNFVLLASVAIPVMQLIIQLIGPVSNCSYISHIITETVVSVRRFEQYLLLRDKRKPRQFSLLNANTEHTGLLCENFPPEDQSTYSSKGYSINTISFPATKPIHTLSTPANETCNSVGPEESSSSQLVLVKVSNARFVWDRQKSMTPIEHPSSIDRGNTPQGTTANYFEVQIKDLVIRRKECVVLIGDPGHGKTSCVLGLLGEMNMLSGSCKIQATCLREEKQVLLDSVFHEASSLAYAAQRPWIPEGTVRSIILFGRSFDGERYEKVVTACDLREDFSGWEGGDEYIVREGGVNLSGGQITRITLARALYDYPKIVVKGNVENLIVGCNVFLLDNVFSSIDPSVGSKIFKALFGLNGLLQNAASLITMDLPSFMFYVDTVLGENKAEVMINFSIKSITDGRVSSHPIPYSNFWKVNAELKSPELHGDQKILDATDPNSEQEDPNLHIVEPHKILQSDSCSQNILNYCEEPSFCGPVGSDTYFWFFKKLGFGLCGIIVMLLILITMAKQANYIWLMNLSTGSVSTKSSSDANSAGIMNLQGNSQLQNNSASASFYPEADGTSNEESLTYPYSEYYNTENHVGDPDDGFTTNETNVVGLEDVPKATGENLEDYTSRVLHEDGLEKNNEVTSSAISTRSSERNLGEEKNGTKDLGLVNETYSKDDSSRLVSPALLIFLGLSFFVIIFTLVVQLTEGYAALKGARKVHNDLLWSVIAAPLWVYDFLSVGLIINRFSGDINQTDVGPVYISCQCISNGFKLFFATAVLCVLVPWGLPLCSTIGVLIYYAVWKLYRSARVEFQKSQLLAFSPLCTQLSEVESGAVTIRALNAEEFYYAKTQSLITNLLKAKFMQLGSNSWAALRLQLFSSPFTLIASIIPALLTLLGFPMTTKMLFSGVFVKKYNSQSAVLIGLAISLAVSLPSLVGTLLTQITFMDQIMCSMQRVKELTVFSEMVALRKEPKEKWKKLKSVSIKIEELPLKAQKPDTLLEETLDISENYEKERVNTLDDLPCHRFGVQIDHLVVSYQKPVFSYKKIKYNGTVESGDIISGLEKETSGDNALPCIKGITALARPGEYVGVLGRTGSGKSTLLLALINAITPKTGVIKIDNCPISNIDRSVLREIVGVLPQNDLILRGWSIRKYLDPYAKFMSHRLYEALEKVNLMKTVSSLPQGIDTVVFEEKVDCSRELSNKRNKTQGVSSGAANEVYPLDSSRESGGEILSSSQLRMLSIGRLYLHSDNYRLVLVDEPPLKQTDINLEKSDQLPSDIELSSPEDKLENKDGFFRKLFPKSTIIVVAHHASSIIDCDSVWVIAKGRLVFRLPGSSFTTQADVKKVIAEAEKRVMDTDKNEVKELDSLLSL